MTRPPVYTEIELDVPIEQAWQTLMAFDQYPDWNAMLPKITAPPRLNGRGMLTVRLNGFPLWLPIKLVQCANHELAWAGNAPAITKVFFDAVHRFQLTAIGEQRCKLVNSESFTGLLAPLVGRIMKRFEHNYDRANVALKQRLEQKR